MKHLIFFRRLLAAHVLHDFCTKHLESNRENMFGVVKLWVQVVDCPGRAELQEQTPAQQFKF